LARNGVDLLRAFLSIEATTV